VIRHLLLLPSVAESGSIPIHNSRYSTGPQMIGFGSPHVPSNPTIALFAMSTVGQLLQGCVLPEPNPANHATRAGGVLPIPISSSEFTHLLYARILLTSRFHTHIFGTAFGRSAMLHHACPADLFSFCTALPPVISPFPIPIDSIAAATSVRERHRN
jgi:hypothetical protein